MKYYILVFMLVTRLIANERRFLSPTETDYLKTVGLKPSSLEITGFYLTL